jgi:chemotaxis signal transduction protein
MAEAIAWIVELGDGLHAAVGERQMVHVVEQPILEHIPYTPAHCQHVLLWEGEMLPVMDLVVWLTGQDTEHVRGSISIVRWQESSDAIPQYGALRFTGMPQKVHVSDNQACGLPAQPAGWQAVALSCFCHDDQSVVILDLPRIFSDALVPCHQAPLTTEQGNTHKVQPLESPEAF